METSSDLKVAQSSRSAIDSLENSKKEFSALIQKLDKEVHDLSQGVRIAGTDVSMPSISRVNKLKLHRRQLQDLLEQMETMDGNAWEAFKPLAQAAYQDAAAARQ